MSGALLSIRGLRLEAATAQGTAHLLRGIDLDIGRGRILGVVGESGSGKSTLAAAVIGLLPANASRTEGAVLFDGTELLGLDPAGRRALRGTRLAMVFQDPMTALNPLFTVGTQLGDVARRRDPALSRRAARERALAMLRAVGIADPDERLGAYPHQLSGGMRQRVMIAMALLVRPDLLIADEPTTALDATVEAQIVALFQELRQALSGSILFISHHLGLVAELCDDLCVMYGGTVVETGPVAEVLHAPRHPYTRALRACEIDGGDDGDAPLAAIPGEPPAAVAPMTGCLYAPRCPLVIERCRSEPPPLRPVGGDRRSACHRAEEVA